MPLLCYVSYSWVLLFAVLYWDLVISWLWFQKRWRGKELDDRGLGRIRGYNWVKWMSRTPKEPHIGVQRYHKYSLQDHKSFIQELGRKFSYSHLYRRLLLFWSASSPLSSYKRNLGLQRGNTLPCPWTCWFVWGWHHLGTHVTKAWPVRVWISPVPKIGSRINVWPSWANETQI